jgi:hypothetical protein
LGEPEEIPLPPTSRAQVIGVAGDPQRPGVLFVGAFDSKYMVTLLEAERGRGGVWRTEKISRLRMAWGLAAGDADGDGSTDLVVARAYGDGRREPGDVLFFPGGAGDDRQQIPSVRGARAVVVTRVAEGRSEVLFSDGWHRKYGTSARALVTRARRDVRAWRTEILANVLGRHSYDRLRVADLEGDGSREIIAVGNGPAVRVALEPAPDGRAMALGERPATDAYPVDLDRDGADEVVLVGREPGADGAAYGWIWRTVAP